MGCSESKIDNVTTVNQCKERIAYMKQLVLAHAAFVSAHFAYASALNNTGSALCHYAQSELQTFHDRPPPPKHSVRPPQQENNGILAWDFFIMLMEDVRGPSSVITDDKQMKNPREHEGVDESGEERPQSSVVEDMKNASLLKLFREVDDGFVKASESVCEVSMIHEANKLHYHSIFADNQGEIKHSTRVMNMINGAKVNLSCEEVEAHATLLDKMLAWEKRLYNQVKAAEKMKSEYQKKMALLAKHRKRGAGSDKLKRTEATVNHLRSKYSVEMQSIDSTISEINRLRDQHLYPKLIQIVEEMGQMWKNMQKQHKQQFKIVQGINNIKTKISQSAKNTSDRNSKNIEQLHLQVMIWCYEFEKLMLHQKEYVRSLNNWLKLNLTCIDHNIKSQNTKIELLLCTWNEKINELSEEEAKTAIRSFGYGIVTIVKYHADEMKMKEKCDEIRREIVRKTRKFEEWCDKQIAKRVPSDEMDVDVMDDMDVITEQQVVVDALKRRLEEEEEEVYRRHRVRVKDMALANLMAALPKVFKAMVEFSGACSHMYESLKSH